MKYLAVLPQIAFEEIGAHTPPAVFSHLPYCDGQLPDDQAYILLSILVAFDPEAVLEIGTFFGHTTLHMAENLPQAIIHTVDLPLDFVALRPTKWMKTDYHLITAREVGKFFRTHPARSRIRQYYADTASWDFHEVGEPVPTFFFIDGSHSYDYVRNDSEKCWELCKGKGVFIWHDVDENHGAVLRLLQQWYEELGREVRQISGTPLGILCTL
jgi:predicted O-methyltransferase YrrM